MLSTRRFVCQGLFGETAEFRIQETLSMIIFYRLLTPEGSGSSILFFFVVLRVFVVNNNLRLSALISG